MAVIELNTLIKSDLNTCFDLSRSIGLHQISTSQTNEKAVAGRTSGLINLDEFVTWLATHFFIRQKLTSKITEFNRPFHFRDEQVKGAFKFIIHDHYFKNLNGMIEMKDIFKFQSPLGIFGKIADKLILKNYLRKLLINRNRIIKEYAESNKARNLLNQ